MSKKFNNKILLIVLGSLIAVFIITNYLKQKSYDEGLLPEHVLEIDSAGVETITIIPKGRSGEQLKFSSNGGKWMVEYKNSISETDEGSVERMIETLRNLEPRRLASRSDDQWEKYSISDTSATLVSIQERGKKEANGIYLGKFSYNPQSGGLTRYGSGQNINGLTYVRRSGEESVYAVEGFLIADIPEDFDSWRKSDFLKFNKESVNQIRFEYPGDESFVVLKSDSVWTLDGEVVNETELDQFLNRYTDRQERSFADSFSPDSLPGRSIVIAGNDMDDLVIKCWKDGDTYYLHSSLNPNVYFESAENGIYAQLFMNREKFLKVE